MTSRAITNLARFGVQVNSENARLLVKYLADVEMYNADMIDIQHSTSKLGWHGNTFVPYDLQSFLTVNTALKRYSKVYRKVETTSSG